MKSKTLSPKSSSVSKKLGSYGKKMKDGGSLGMKSVKAGFDKNPGVTRADIITAATKKAQNGKKMQGVKGMSENEKLKKGITRLAPVNGKPVKKAQDGYTGEPGFAERGGPMRKTKVKERSTDGNYVTKTVTRERKGAKNVSSKTRRSFQGFLTGAPTVKEMKSGGKMKKCKGGC
jgi:hypothetical protein